MGIQALPNSTVRVLGASQVLNDPAAVIKELVDNALDARATSIAIEISNNTLDSIQVRDNGHGIPPEDRQLVARPHCTSKIGNEEDLKDIGGTSLGFRGEALASVAEMSSSLTISTRVEGEQVAIALKINQQGQVTGQERASLPIGTTIKIADFLKSLSVRKQVALKNTEKCLKKIKQTLQSYAFARPHVRVSLRILKAKNDKANWMYAPKTGGNAEDAAFKIVGAACASQCIWSVVEDEGFTLQAFLPRNDADVSKVSSIGSFLSVDARPVSAARGTPKQIVKIFKETMKKADSRDDVIKEPFVYLDITCPTGSYDANVEPAKDDVLFANPDIVVAAARRLFEAVYPVKERSASDQDVVQLEPVDPRPGYASAKGDDFMTSLEQPRLEHPMFQTSVSGDREALSADLELQPDLFPEHDSRDQDVAAGARRSFRNNMYGCDEEDLDLIDARPPTGRTEADFEEMRQARKDVKLSNPWVMAKMNAAVRRPKAGEDIGLQLEAEQDASPQRPQPSSQQSNVPRIDLDATGLPTPRPSSPSPPSQDFHPSDYVPQTRLARDGRLIGSQSLPPPELLMPSPSFHDADEDVQQPEHRRTGGYDYTLSSQHPTAPAGTPLYAIPDATNGPRRSPQKKTQQAQINKPFVSPMPDQALREKVWFDHLENENSGRARPTKRRQHQARNNDGLVAQGELRDLVEDPRQLTPPRRNRDMRDFVTSVAMTGGDSVTSMIESRNYPLSRRARSVTDADRVMTDGDRENDGPVPGVLGAPGFLPASELAAFEARFGSSQREKPRSTKRRKTSESRALREVSGNAGRPDDDEEYQLRPNSRAASRRRRTTDGNTSKPRRTKSAKLPLERIPAGQGIHNVLFTLATSMRGISRFAGKIDEESSLLAWNKPATEAYDGFAGETDPQQIHYLTMRLRDLLINRVSDGEMVQDLGGLVCDAFAIHTEGNVGGSVAE